MNVSFAAIQYFCYILRFKCLHTILIRHECYRRNAQKRIIIFIQSFRETNVQKGIF